MKSSALFIGVAASSVIGPSKAFTHTNNSARTRCLSHGTSYAIALPSPVTACSSDSAVPLCSSRTSLHAKSAGRGGGGGIQRPENEFSRRYRTDTVLPSGRTARDYKVSIEANEEERAALAARFRLSEITRLEADVVLRRDKSGSAYDSDDVHMDGTVLATVTQKCVRTNEDFDVNLEFDVNAAVRPVQSTETNDDADMEEIERALASSGGGGGGGGGGGKKRNKRGGGGKHNKSIRSDRSLDDVGMKALQDMLQEFDVEEDVVEDEAVLGPDGYIDIGELVAQLFRLKLDPYPKKPGSKPINLSFSG